MRRVGLLLAAALVAAFVPISSTVAAPSGCSATHVRGLLRDGGDIETVVLRTYHVVLKPTKKSYRVGETAVIRALVTRPAHEDPAGLGQEIDPPRSFPAEGANVGIGVRVGDVFLFGFAVTDADGKANIEVDILPYTPAGKAFVDGFAWKRQAEAPCAAVEENGYTYAPGLFTVTR